MSPSVHQCQHRIQKRKREDKSQSHRRIMCFDTHLFVLFIIKFVSFKRVKKKQKKTTKKLAAQRFSRPDVHKTTGARQTEKKTYRRRESSLAAAPGRLVRPSTPNALDLSCPPNPNVITSQYYVRNRFPPPLSPPATSLSRSPAPRRAPGPPPGPRAARRS